MLVTCARCKSPVYVSTAAVAVAPAEVVCAGCGAELVATASGDARLRDESGTPSGGQGVALPGYEGGPGPVGSEPAGRLPRFLELVPPVAAPASEQGGTSALAPPRGAVGPERAPAGPVRESPARAEPGPDGRDRAHGPVPAAATAARRSPVAPPHGRPGEPVAILPPSAAGAHAIVVGAPSPRLPAAEATGRPAPAPHPSGSVAHLAALGALGGALVVVGLAARWGLPAGTPPDRPPVAAAAASPVAAAPTAGERALAHYRRANELLEADQPGDALRELEACVAMAPELGVAYRSLGVAYMRLGREASAIEAYERFVRLEPRHRDADEARRIIEAYRSHASER